MATESGHSRVPRAQRAEQLLDVTLQLIAEGGYEHLSVAAIAAAAGITKPIIYRIYPSRQALLLALFRREQKRIDRVLDDAVPRDAGGRHPAAVVIDGLRAILSSVSEHPLTWRLALFPSEGTPATLRAVVSRRRAALLRRARILVEWAEPYLATDEPPDSEMLARMLLTWAEEHARILLEDEQMQADHLISSAYAMLAAIAWKDRTGTF
jgi:AcrR family transcriptional regulator